MRFDGSVALAVSGTLFSLGTSATALQTREHAFSIRDAKPFAKPAPLIKGHSGSLTRLGHPESRSALRRRSLGTADYTTNVTKRYGGLDYSLSLLWGTQQLDVEVDSGSSDLWVAHTNFTCYNLRGEQTYIDYCGFGELYSGGFQENITNENFNISYGSGDLRGCMGYEDITVGNLTVTKQEVAIAYEGYWDGDNKTAGLMGFAYPSITSAYYGTNFTNDSAHNFAEYDPFFFSAFKRGLIPAVWSLALERGPENGYAGQLALGGLPGLPGLKEENFTSVPIKVVRGQDGTDKKVFDFYAFELDGWTVNGNYTPEEKQGYQTYIVDSGNDELSVSPKIASIINAKYSPPAKYNKGNGQYQIPCNATAPDVSVRINGTDFPIDGSDLILPAKAGNYQRQRGYCVPVFQVGGRHGNNALGDPFLKNAVVVFDVGAAELKFAAHKY